MGGKADNSFHIPCDNTANEVFCIYFSTHDIEFLSPSLMKVIYFLGISSESLIGRESAHIDCCKYLAIS